MYGKKYMGAARTTFVIGKDGKIEHVFEKVKPEGHDQEVLEYLLRRAGESPAHAGTCTRGKTDKSRAPPGMEAGWLIWSAGAPANVRSLRWKPTGFS